MGSVNTIVFMGRPGSGKGTQAKLLAERQSWPIFSTGNRFKEIREDAGILGNRVREAYDAGKLLPDWLASYLFEGFFLELTAEQGAICEGYPRSLGQAELFESVMTWLGRPYIVVNLEVPEDETLRRQIERAKVEHRPDSDDETIKTRFAEYERNTAPVLAFFKERGKLMELDGTPDIETIQKDVIAKLGLA